MSHGKHGRHDHEAGKQSRLNGKVSNPQRRIGNVGGVLQVGAIGHHDAAAQRKAEECKAHGIQNAHPGEFIKAEVKEKFHAFPTAGQRHAANNEHDHQNEKRRHQHLGKALHPLVDAAQHDNGRDEQEKQQHQIGAHAIGDESPEIRTQLLGRDLETGTSCRIGGVLQTPAAYDRIERKNQEDSKNADAAENAPGLAANVVKAAHRTAATGASHREFSKQKRHADRDGKEDIRKHEHGSAVGAGHVGELPNGPKPNGRARRSQNKSQA